MRRFACLVALGGILMASQARAALDAAVKPHQGSPTIFVNGKPTSPLMFFGWATGAGPTAARIDTEWKEYSLTFIAPEDNEGHAGVHFRVGGAGPGTVWVDNVRLYPGPKVEEPTENLLRHGDWEASKEEIGQAWSLYQAEYAGADADWSLDPTTKVTGQQSVRIDIRNAGRETMHLHFYQTGCTVKKGQRYTYSLWMKADKPRKVDFMALRIGEPWTIYSGEQSHYQEQVRLARQAGVHLYSFGIDMPWPRPGEDPNFSQCDRAIENTLNADPEALLLPRFGMGPPEWWLQQHPDDRMLFDDGRTEGWSMASTAWRAEMQEHLRALVRHCEEKYGDHMLGYHPCGQHTGEWFYNRSWEPVLSDFSPAMSRGFAAWLQTKYPNVEALRTAWGDPDITFAAVAVPTKEEQLTTSLGFFRDPRRERKVIDYFEYKQVAMEEPLELMARVIKEETGGKKLVCLFYGYLFDMHGLPMGAQHSGHLAMAKLVQCPDVDILCSPISYLDREQGGAGNVMAAVDTVRAAGKLWLNEDDTRTYLTPVDAGFGRVETPEATLWVHQRNFAQIWPRRMACWYMDLANEGWLNGRDLWQNISRLQRFAQENLDRPARWQPEVALIVDEVGPFYTRCTNALLSPLVYQMRSQFSRLGTPFAIYLLSDLVAGRVPPMKAYFFANAFHLDAAQRAAVARVTRGKTAVWFYGGGFLDDDASDENMSRAIGLKLVRVAARPGRVIPAGGEGSPLEPFGNDTRLDPCWVVADPAAQVIGRYADGGVAAAAKRTPAGLRVYLGAIHCPAKLLRAILKRSGVHLYCDSDEVILTDGEFLSITATSTGEKRLRFPRPRTVVTAYDGQEIARGVRELRVPMRMGETQTYLLR